MPETIEAEVIEIDGIAPPRAAMGGEEGASSSARPRAGMHGAILNLDRRWWPLWVVLGVLAVVIAATVGVALGVCYLIFALIRGVLRSLFGGYPAGGGGGSGNLRRG